MKPALVERVEDARGLVVHVLRPERAAEFVRPEVLEQVITAALEDAVDLGTAKRARLERWRIGGKTGTAKKQIGRGYDATRNRSSFIALAPIEAPAILVAVTVDDPRSKGGDPSGGLVAAPVVREILEAALPYLRVPPSPKPPIFTK
jgi:cell division protein FtsI/penicillin-binding protein 2